MSNKITLEEYSKFIKEYNDGIYPHSRLGQAFLNKYFKDVVDNEVFYEEDYWPCAGMIAARYVKFE